MDDRARRAHYVARRLALPDELRRAWTDGNANPPSETALRRLAAQAILSENPGPGDADRLLTPAQRRRIRHKRGRIAP